MTSGRRIAGALLVAMLGLHAGPASYAEPPSSREAVRKIQPDINKAIDRGVLWLLAQQRRDGSWSAYDKQYRGGMTALALYALVRSGVPRDHPAVRHGLAHLLTWDPQQTYSIACELLALEALEDPLQRERIERLATRLLGWQRHGWGYPYEQLPDAEWRERMGRTDLSNTQYAALGLRAAQHAGFELPPKALQDLVRETLTCQEEPRETGARGARGRPILSAGFSYHGTMSPHGRGKPSGSMTCAGITILDICREHLGPKIRPKVARRIEEGIAQGLVWLEENWNVQANPGNEKSHKLYYLYGLERVGSLLKTLNIGEHPWYLEGARELLKTQKDGGNFGDQPETCFALLFLVRATGQGTGKPLIASVLGRYATEDEKSPLRLRAEGHSPLSLWITSFDAKVTRAYPDLRVERVEYVVDGDVVATVHGDRTRPWRNETFPVVHHFPGRGTYEVQARAYLAGSDATAPTDVVTSAPLKIEVKIITAPWAEQEARRASHDLLSRAFVKATASTTNADHQTPDRTVDGVTSRYWVSKADDPRPTLRLELKRSVTANTVILHPVTRQEDQRGLFDHATRVEVRVNREKEAHVLAMDPDDLRPTALRLPKTVRVKRLEIAIAERLPGSRWSGQAGFGGVALEVALVAMPTLERDDDGRVTLACETRDAQIHYTLDGQVPTEASQIYTAPFSRPEATRLQAIARLPTGETSRLLVADLPLREGYLALDRGRWRVLRVDSEQLPGHPVGLVFDGNPLTHWHTRHDPVRDPHPHEIVIDLGESLLVEGFTYRARREGSNGNVRDWRFYVTDDLESWGPAVGAGLLESVKGLQRGMLIGPSRGRYVRFVALSEVNGQPFTSCAEFDILARRP